MRLRILLVLLAFLGVGEARAQSESAEPMVEVVVPVVGSVNGANDTRWRTDLDLRNDSPGKATVAIILAIDPDDKFAILEFAPGETKHIVDVVATLFSTSALSPLIVRTQGRRSIGIRATAYGVRGTEVFKPEPIAISYGESSLPIRTLRGLSFNDTFRTNVGLANLGDTDAVFVLALQRLSGRNVAVTRLTVAPGALWHVPIQMLFPLITAGDDFSIVIETSSPQTYVYASVIENETNSATFVPP